MTRVAEPRGIAAPTRTMRRRDGDVGAIARAARAVDDRAVRDEEVVRTLCRDTGLLREERVSVTEAGVPQPPTSRRKCSSGEST